MINPKQCRLSIVLTAQQKSLKKVILPTITSPECQHNAKLYHFLLIFAVFDPSPLTLRINSFLVLLFAVLMSKLCNEFLCNY